MDHRRFVRSVDATGAAMDEARWVITDNNALVFERHDDRLGLLDTPALRRLGLEPAPVTFLGYLDGRPCWLGDLPGRELPPPLAAVDLRGAFGLLPEIEYGLAGYAVQIANWERTSHFCPACGGPAEAIPGERAKRCPACGFSHYPRVSPAIIVLIYREGEVLLTRQATWPPKRYSLVAGFVEPGESLETCVQREIAEEVGVSVDTIRYLGSQPWAFPHQLMVGFVARYAGGELRVDPGELEDAAWFALDALPDLPSPLSISRQIINWHLRDLVDPATPFPVDHYPM